MSKSIREQLLALFEASGLTLPELTKRSGLELDAHSLGRKLRGVPGAPGKRPQSLRDYEVEAVARALRSRVVLRPSRETRAA